MPQLLAPPFGNGGDGPLSISANTTDSPIDSACTGTSGTTSLTATNASFMAGQLIMVHQTRGTGAGKPELNKIDSYVGGTITTVSPLSNAYTSGAQVLVVEQHSGITIDSGKTLTAKAWNGTVGGIVALMSSGLCDVNGTISANGVSSTSYVGGAGKGYRGGNGEGGGGHGEQAYCGEGTEGASIKQNAANGNGGGGGAVSSSGSSSGGGGGNGTVGTKGGGVGSSGGQGGDGGGVAGVASLTTMVFGGGGGGGAEDTDATSTTGGGGGGGGIVVIFADTITIAGLIRSNGGAGRSYDERHGGGGAGGSILIKAKKAILGANKITASGGAGGSDSSSSGGAGGVGRIRCEACSLTGTTSPSLSSVIGGQNYCGGIASILE